MYRFQDLQLFVQVVERNSLSEVAKINQVTAASISIRLTHIETKLGVKLIYRNKKNTQITEAGRDFYLFCKNILTDLDNFSKQIKIEHQNLVGRVKILLHEPLVGLPITPLLVKFLQDNPQAQVKINTSNTPEQDLQQFDYDFALCLDTFPRSLPNLVKQKIADNFSVFVASKTWLNRLEYPLTHPQDMEKCPLLLHTKIDHSGYDSLQIFNRNYQHFTIQSKPILRSNDLNILKSWCINGAGILLLPLWCATEELAGKQVIRVLPDYLVDSGSIVCLQRKKLQNETTRKILQLILHFFDEEQRRLAGFFS